MVRAKACVALIVSGLAILAPAPYADAQTAADRRVLDRADYQDRLRAMWLGETIANWTGLRTEGGYTQPPFLTDQNWLLPPAPGYPPLDYVLGQDPWLADDDTDVEYVYLHLLNQHGTLFLTPQQIADGWIAHINRFIWVSNAETRGLIGRGVLPPATGLGAANRWRLQIDAQLTTEIFGALAPGMPELALRMSELPIRTVASGHAAHASQFYIVLYSLATQVDPALSGREKSLWLFHQARRYIPSTSKAADIADFVLADFLANPDPDNWERTRDLVYQRYDVNAAANGFEYRGWTESSVNFACGMIELLYGGCDYRHTVEIGTLSGWDSDNATATMGGLIGLMLGTQQLMSQFPGVSLSDRFNIYRTRDALPDFLPGDPAAEDTFTMMAARVSPIIERAITFAGGFVNHASGQWLLPPPAPFSPAAPSDLTAFNPLVRETARSHNLGVRAADGSVTAASTAAPSSPPFFHPYPYGLSIPDHLANGSEPDLSGAEPGVGCHEWERIFYSTQNSGALPGQPLTFSVTYDRPVLVHTIRFIEGDHFYQAGAGGVRGGWLTDIHPQLLVGGVWIDPAPAPAMPTTPDPSMPFQIIDWVLASPVVATGVRITGIPGGDSDGGPFATIAELDALAPPAPPPTLTSFDFNADGQVDLIDLYTLAAGAALPLPPPGADLDGDGAFTPADLVYLERAVRWDEATDMKGPQR